MKIPLQHLYSNSPYLDDHSLDGFFTGIETLTLGTAGRVNALWGRFLLARYHESLFTQSGILCPHTIRKSVPKRQAEYLAGRHLSQLLCAHQGMVSMQIPSGRHGQPLWPTGWLGSISHTDTVAIACMCRISQIGMLGIDLENELSPEIACNIAPTIVELD